MPVDGSVFDLETGEPTEGPAADPVPVFPVREVDGWIEVLPVSGPVVGSDVSM